MQGPKLNIRHASVADLPALLSLRNYYVENSFATFDEQPLSITSLEAWYAGFSPSGPYQLLVAEAEGTLLGFCCSQQYRAHPAFARTIETSIYTDPTYKGQGIGSALYERLFAILRLQGLHRAVVGIALPNDASIALHARLGFSKVGIFSEYALKNGTLISSQWMERSL
jgi:phosphinothricin acetyltransferase